MVTYNYHQAAYIAQGKASALLFVGLSCWQLGTQSRDFCMGFTGGATAQVSSPKTNSWHQLANSHRAVSVIIVSWASSCRQCDEAIHLKALCRKLVLSLPGAAQNLPSSRSPGMRPRRSQDPVNFTLQGHILTRQIRDVIAKRRGVLKFRKSLSHIISSQQPEEIWLLKTYFCSRKGGLHASTPLKKAASKE